MISQLEQSIFAGMLFFIMLGMGASLTPRDFFLAMKRPQALLIALVSQFGFMPLIAFTLAILLQLPPTWAVGLLIVGCVPGGSTSNIFTYFSKGDLALSILMTVNSTLFGLVLTPLMIVLYSQRFVGDDFQIPIQNIIVTLALLIVPVVAGMILRKVSANIGALVEFIGSILGILFIFVLIGSWVPRNFSLLLESPWQAYAAAIGIGVWGFFFGGVFCRVLKMPRQQIQTIAIETGVQNGVLAIGIVLLSFSDSVKNDVVLIPALYSLFIVITASFLTIAFRRYNLAKEQKIPELL